MKMQIKAFLESIRPEVDAEIEKIIPREIDDAWLEWFLDRAEFKYPAQTISQSVAEPIWNFLDRGGKRWRPGLVLLACEAVGGNRKKAMAFTPLVELVHNGTIMADDIEDNSQTRRGKPCTHLIYGIDVALNDSNIMYFLPLILLYRNAWKLDEHTKNRIYDLYAQEMMRVSIGQAVDILWHKSGGFSISEDEYLQMATCKTGVLARFAGKLGAILGGGTPEQEEALARFSSRIGVAFQIQDDVLNLVGEEFQKGKGVGEDIHEGKRTLILLRAYKELKPTDADRLVEIVKMHTDDQKLIDEAISLIQKTDALEYARKKSRDLVEEAWTELDKVLPESEAKATLKDFADYMITREI